MTPFFRVSPFLVWFLGYFDRFFIVHKTTSIPISMPGSHLIHGAITTPRYVVTNSDSHAQFRCLFIIEVYIK
jgi:hypothetical protein